MARAIEAWEVHLPSEQKRDLLARISFLLNDESIPYTAKLRLKRKQLIVVLIGLYNDLYSQPGWEDLLFTGERPLNDEPDTEEDETGRTKFDAFTRKAECGIAACYDLTRDVQLPKQTTATISTGANAPPIMSPDEFDRRVEMINLRLDDPEYRARFADELRPVQLRIVGDMNQGRRQMYWKGEVPSADALEVLKRQYDLAGWSLLVIPQAQPGAGGSFSWRRKN